MTSASRPLSRLPGWPGPAALHVRTFDIADPGSLLDMLPGPDGFAWVRNGDGFVGWGAAARSAPLDLPQADAWWSEIVADASVESSLGSGAPPGSGLVAFGSFVFDPAHSASRSVLVVPQVVVGRRGGRCWVTLAGAAPDSRPGFPEPTRTLSPGQIAYGDGALTGPQWQVAVAEVVRRITQGRLDKAVLARDLIAVAERPVDPRWLTRRLTESYPRCWTYAVDGLVGATPEMLARREAGLATSRVLAGTIRRTGNDRQDLALAAALAQSSKDLEEHEYAVRSVAAALAPHCSGMNVPDAPYVLELPNVLHLATDVTAVADPGASSLALAAALHPSAAVCGTPTAVARATIAEVEQMDRGRYAGPVGWIDANGDGEWGIALRCGQLADDRRSIRLYAGCGIVAGSDPAAELAESVAKLVPMRDALGG